MYEELSVHDISIDENARTIILQQGLIPLVDATLEFVVILLHKRGVHDVIRNRIFPFSFCHRNCAKRGPICKEIEKTFFLVRIVMRLAFAGG